MVLVQGLSAAAVLDVWERGRGAGYNNGMRALLMLAAACPGLSGEALAGLTIGKRDGLLLTVRERTFGPVLPARTDCPACAERLEFHVPVSALGLSGRAARRTTGDGIGRSPDTETSLLRFLRPEGEIRFRLPTAGDLAAIDPTSTVEEGIDALLAACLVGTGDRAESSGADGFSARVAPELASDVSARLAAADPQAEVVLGLACAGCGHTWQVVFDIAGFLWAELTAQARRLLLEVDALARAYGWREADILAMSAFRRQAYLQLG